MIRQQHMTLRRRMRNKQDFSDKVQAVATMKRRVDARRIWVIRPGKRLSPECCREHEQVLLEHGIAGLIDDYRLGDLRNGKRTRDEMCAFVASSNSELHRIAIGSVVGNLMKFASDLHIDDWVLCPSRIAKVYRVGIVGSVYRFDAKAKFQHIRDVKWIGEISKESLSIGAQRELGAARLLFECKRNAAEVESHVLPLIGKVGQR